MLCMRYHSFVCEIDNLPLRQHSVSLVPLKPIVQCSYLNGYKKIEVENRIPGLFCSFSMSEDATIVMETFSDAISGWKYAYVKCEHCGPNISF